LRQLLTVVADCGASVITVHHDRFSSKINLEESKVHVVCEVSGVEHGKELVNNLELKGYRVLGND
jgi:ACT domain-containing protein